MKTPSSDLFYLIKSLEQTEKRYFRIFTSMHKGNKNYLKLFDTIEKQTFYNEDVVKKLFKTEAFTKELSFTKKYLYNLILKSMESYHAKKDDVMILKSYLFRIDFLGNKALLEQCEKQLNKAKEFANKSEKFIQLLDILSLEKNLLAGRQKLKRDYAIETNNQEINEALSKLNNFYQYSNLLSTVFECYRIESTIRDASVLKKIDDLLKNPLLRDYNNALSMRAQIIFCMLHGFISQMKQNHKESYQYRKKIMELIEIRPSNYSIAFINSSTYNLLLSEINLKLYDEAFISLDKMKRLPLKSTNEKNSRSLQIIDVEIELIIRTCRFERILTIIPVIEETIAAYEAKFQEDTFMLLTYNASYMLFIIERYNDALNWLIISFQYKTKNNAMTDLASFAKIYLLILHYELGNERIIESLVKSTYQYLLKRGALRKTEAVLLAFIRKKIPLLVTKQDVIKYFTELKDELQEILKDPLEAPFLSYFDLISWLQSKIENRPFAVVLKEKYQKNRDE